MTKSLPHDHHGLALLLFTIPPDQLYLSNSKVGHDSGHSQPSQSLVRISLRPFLSQKYVYHP